MLIQAKCDLVETYCIDNINEYYNRFFKLDNSIEELSNNLHTDEVLYLVERRKELLSASLSIAYELHKVDDVLRYFFWHKPDEDWFAAAINFSKENGGKKYEDID